MSAPSSPSSRWLLSLPADLAVMVLPPFLALGAVLAVSTWLEGSLAFSVVLTTLMVGHHAPGFLRAYGDTTVFARHRRVLLAAPIAMMSVAFTLLHTGTSLGLDGLIVLWAVWHAGMQLYGLMRYYDPASNGHRPTAVFDGVMCFLLFAVVYLFGSNGAAAVSTVQHLYALGAPQVDAATMSSLRDALRWSCGLFAFAYLAFAAWAASRGKTSVHKYLLLVSTAVFLLGVSLVPFPDVGSRAVVTVLFSEALHDLQYGAFVYSVERRAGREVWRAPLQRLVGTGGLRLALFVGVVMLGYGAGFSWLVTSALSGGSALAKHVVGAVVVSSTVLHYYFDAFIWKRERPEDVADTGSTLLRFLTRRSRRSIIVQATVASLVLAVTVSVQVRTPALGELEVSARMAQTFPRDPTVSGRYAAALVSAGRPGDAAREYRRLLNTAKGAPDAYLSLAESALGSGDRGACAALLTELARLGPEKAQLALAFSVSHRVPLGLADGNELPGVER